MNKILHQYFFSRIRNEKKMKILYFTSSFPRYDGDFKGSFLVDQVKFLSELGDEIKISTPRSNIDKIYNIHNCLINRFPYFKKNLERISLKTIESSIHPSPEWFFYLGAAIKEILKEKCDIIHSHWLVPFGLVSTFRKFVDNDTPLIITSHGQDINIPWKKPQYRALIKLTFKKADRIIFVAEHLKKKALKLKLEESKALVIPLGIDTEVFNPRWQFKDSKQIKEITSRIPPNTPIIGTLCSLIPRKNVIDLLKAIKLINKKFDCYVVIGGEGEQKKYLEKYCGQNDIKNIFFAGRIERVNVPAFLAILDIFVLASEGEGLAIALQEAMAMENVPIVSNFNECNELIKHQHNGFYYKHKNIGSLAKAIEYGINNKSTLSINARGIIKDQR